MIVKTPKISNRELDGVGQIWQLHKQIAPLVAEPNRCMGLLRRQALARTVRASNSIEGFEATLPQTQELFLNENHESLDQSTKTALTGYRDAMTFVMQLAKDERLLIDETLLKSCHFMTTKDSFELRPGRYRVGQVFVHDETSNAIVYEGAPHEACQSLVAETLELANNAADEFDIITAAMVHLNLVLIHPFKDGNGRISRIMQSAVLSRTNRLSPVFLSIEEYLAANTQKYYSVLAQTSGSSWNPRVDATGWLHFCLEAHWQQANAVKMNAMRANLLWVEISQKAQMLGLHERTISPLAFVATGNRLTNESYRALLRENGDEVTPLTASRDLSELSAQKLLTPRGENRTRDYVSGSVMQKLVESVEIEIMQKKPTALFD
jgi:Fic family protein